MRRLFRFVPVAIPVLVFPACSLDPLEPGPSSSSSSSASSAGGAIGACSSPNCPKPPPTTIAVELRQTLEQGARTMAISGDTLVALCGSVRVFDRVNGSFTLSHVVEPEVGHAPWESVAIYQDMLVLGAPQENGGRGLVVLFPRVNGVWPDKGIAIAPEEPLDGENFGASVAVHGDVLLVGAPTALGSSAPEAVYVFRDDGDSFVQTNKVVVSSGDYDTSFGSHIAFGGVLGVVGAPDQGVTGAAYLLRQNGNYWFSHEQFWYAPNAPVIGIGSAVAASDDGRTLAAASFGGLDNAVVTTRIAQNGDQATTLLDAPVDAPKGVAFGISIALGNDFVAVGSSRWADSSPASGAVHVYGYSGQTIGYYSPQWEEPLLLTSPAQSNTDAFGSVLFASGDTLLVGSSADAGTCTAKTYIYQITPKMPQ